MENSILFSDEAANKLNDRVELEIASHLFLFSGYYPDYLYPPNEDGKYHLAVANLYSIFKDTAWVILDFTYIYTGEKKPNREFVKSISTDKLKRIYDTVSDLRTLLGHTSSAGDPLTQCRCEKWFGSILGLEKPKPETSHDYYLLLQELEKYAEVIVEECGKFIDCVKTATNNELMITRWEDVIIKKYILKRDMFQNAVSKYLYSSSINIDKPYKAMEKLIVSYYYYDFEMIKSLAANPLPDEISDNLNKQADDLSSKRVEKLNQEIQDLNLPSLESLYPCNRKRLDKKITKKLVDYFFSHELELLIRNQLNRSSDKSLSIEDIVVRLFDKTATVLDFPNGEKRFDRFNRDPRYLKNY